MNNLFLTSSLTYKSYHSLLGRMPVAFAIGPSFEEPPQYQSTVYTISANSRNSQIFTLRYRIFGCHKING